MTLLDRRAFARAAAALALSPLAARAAVPAPANPICRSPAADMTLLKTAMAQGRFVSYEPTSMKVTNGQLGHADDDSIRADLEALRPYFDSLITYGALNGTERIPDLAAEQGFRAVVIGVWDFYNRQELENALAAAARQPKLVAGLTLGNEIVLGKRGGWGDLGYTLTQVRQRMPSLPLTVTEPFAQFLDDPDAHSTLLGMDFMCVNIHPIFETWFAQATATNWADFVAKVVDRLQALFCGPILVKETGVPTGPLPKYTPQMQHDFWRALEARMPRTQMRSFSYFSAFDAPWRINDFSPMNGPQPQEAFWGLFSEDRRPKPVMMDMPALAGAPSSGF